jgi:hypothetical protein
LPFVKRSEGRKKTIVRGLDDGPGLSQGDQVKVIKSRR